jgi:hypothetical protein
VKRREICGEEDAKLTERVLDIELTEYGRIMEDIELICCMTSFRRRLLVHHIGERFYWSVELEPSQDELKGGAMG